MSKFSDRPSDDSMTATVQGHFGVNGAAKGANADTPLTAPNKYPPFGRPGTGVNYREKSWAGDGDDAFTRQFGK